MIPRPPGSATFGTRSRPSFEKDGPIPWPCRNTTSVAPIRKGEASRNVIGARSIRPPQGAGHREAPADREAPREGGTDGGRGLHPGPGGAGGQSTAAIGERRAGKTGG